LDIMDGQKIKERKRRMRKREKSEQFNGSRVCLKKKGRRRQGKGLPTKERSGPEEELLRRSMETKIKKELTGGNYAKRSLKKKRGKDHRPVQEPPLEGTCIFRSHQKLRTKGPKNHDFVGKGI